MTDTKIISGSRFEFSYGRSAFLKEGHDNGLFDYAMYSARPRVDFFGGRGLSAFASVGLESVHGSPATLGSLRLSVATEIGGRYQLPVTDTFSVVAEISPRLGYGMSRLNFGDGTSPKFQYRESGVREPVMEWLFGGTFRAGINFKGIDLLFGASAGYSTREYTEYGWYLMATIPTPSLCN